MRHRSVTYSSERYIPGSGRSHSPCRPRPFAAGQPACRRNRRRLSRFPSCDFQTPAPAAPRASRARAPRGPPPRLPARSRTSPRRRYWLDQYRQLLERNLASLKQFVEAEHAKETRQAAAKPNLKRRSKLQKEISDHEVDPYRHSTRILLIAATAALTQTAAQKSFDQIKSLAGNWEGRTQTVCLIAGFFS